MRQSILRKNVAGFSYLLTYVDIYTLIVIYVHVYIHEYKCIYNNQMY